MKSYFQSMSFKENSKKLTTSFVKLKLCRSRYIIYVLFYCRYDRPRDDPTTSSNGAGSVEQEAQEAQEKKEGRGELTI